MAPGPAVLAEEEQDQEQQEWEEGQQDVQRVLQFEDSPRARQQQQQQQQQAAMEEDEVAVQQALWGDAVGRHHAAAAIGPGDGQAEVEDVQDYVSSAEEGESDNSDCD